MSSAVFTAVKLGGCRRARGSGRFLGCDRASCVRLVRRISYRTYRLNT